MEKNYLRIFHRFSAIIIAAYACLHIANHLVGLYGIEAHLEFMHRARIVYRQPTLETLLLMAVAFQVVTGFIFIIRGWKQRKGFISLLQASSGIYLIFFFLNHIGAVLYGRNALHLNTNFYYAAAGIHAPSFRLYFFVYYFLAVFALFIHLGCALYWQVPKASRVTRLLTISVTSIIGCIISLLIVLMLSGVFYYVSIPAEYTSTYEAVSK